MDIVQFLSKDGCFLCDLSGVSIGTFSMILVTAKEFAPKSYDEFRLEWFSSRIEAAEGRVSIMALVGLSNNVDGVGGMDSEFMLFW